ncbi:MAG: helix-turn-helix domain-containing protein [Nitrospirales bacterium]
MSATKDQYVSVAELATMLNVSEYIIRALAKKNTVPSMKVGRQWRFNVGAVERALKQRG